ncbi:hypothetical protein B0H11DRAFT_687431 [Mycena galericulata]|nr:hypothetical protein B0H11DRAFT_687431 [Mycena galericulata]
MEVEIDTGVDRRPRKRMRVRSRSSSSRSPPSRYTASASSSPPSPSTPPSPGQAPPPPSPLLALPAELLTLIALRLATLPPNLGPPAALLPLLQTCRAVYERLTWRSSTPGPGRKGNAGLWARIGRAKFALPSSTLDDYPPFDDLAHDDFAPAHLPAALRPLHTHLTTLRVLRTGDPYHPLAARALRDAYAMLVADAHSPACGLDTSDVDGAGAGGRRVKERVGLSRGTPSLASLGLTSSSAAAASSSTADQRGLHGRGRTMTSPGKSKNRRQLAWAGARAFALRWVRERLWEGRFGEGGSGANGGRGRREGGRREEGAWKAGWPRDTDAGAAALWVLWFFEDGATLHTEPDPLRRHLMRLLLPFVVAPFRYPSALCPPHHYTLPLLPAARRGQAGAGRITVPTNHGAYPIYVLGAPAPAPRGVGGGDSSSGGAGGGGAGGGDGVVGVREGGGGRGGVGRGRRRPRLLTAPPARLLFFARIQVGGRMGVPPHLPRDRAAAGAVYAAAVAAGGGTNAGPPIGPTQADIHEKNARPVVRFERQLGCAAAGEEGVVFVDEEEEGEDAAGGGEGFGEGGGGGRARWAAHAWRARLCRGYGDADLWAGVDGTPEDAGGRQGRGGAAPGRIGRVYELGSFAGLWCGTMLMPSEAPYNALLAVPGGAFPPGGLARDDFVAAARPVYMRIVEHHSFHPHMPLPPPPADSTTGEEGMHAGWLPPGTRVVGIGGGRVEVRADAGAAVASSSSRRGEETAHVYETVVEGRVRDGAHDVETCPGCARVRERERAMRARWAVEAQGAGGASPLTEELSFGDSDPQEQERSSSSQSRASSSHRSQADDSMISSISELEHDSTGANADADANWPEWGAPAWGNLGFDEGWEGACDGVQDIVFSGGTDPNHGMAWHHYEYAGRVRPWDGLIGLVMRPRNRTIGLATYFISGHLVGRDTFEGTWQMASQDVLAPSWGGSVCFARAEE